MKTESNEKTLSLERALMERLSKSEITTWLKNYAKPYQELMAYYRCALMEVETKFNVLNEELSLVYDRNPIETIKSRIKSPESIIDKVMRKGIPLTVDSIEKNISDIAGIRVICAFPNDIYMLSEALLRQDDVRLITRKDYIRQPKDNGYRSLHVIIRIPVYFLDKKELIPVEIQLRTIAMDFWASLEHDLKYKAVRRIQGIDSYHELKDCSRIIEEVESRMQILARALDADDED